MSIDTACTTATSVSLTRNMGRGAYITIASRLLMRTRAIAALELVAVPLNLAVLKRLIAMVQTVRAGDPFVAANAQRLQAIAWFLLGQQILSLMIGFIDKSISTPGHPLHL